ncbi:MAG: C39 family peptidase, partial [Candidatus Bathyarchaeia archaeon]
MEFIKLARVFGSSILLLLVLFIVIFGLSGNAESYEFNEFYLYGVPYINQGNTYWCGPTSLSMVLNYWGYNITKEDIASQIYDPQNRLTTISNMTLYPQALGFDTADFAGSISYIQLYIQKGIPLIVLQKFSLQNSYGHYRVVVGYNSENKTIITLDPAMGKDYVLSYDIFVELWKPGSTFSTYNWTLVITPRNEVLVNLMNDYQIYLNQGSHKLQLELDALKQKYTDLEIQNKALINDLNVSK